MSGALDPDTTGTYEQIARWGEFPAFRRVLGGWYLWFAAPGTFGYITPELGIIPLGADPYWSDIIGFPYNPLIFEPIGDATGDATVTFPWPLAAPE